VLINDDDLDIIHNDFDIEIGHNVDYGWSLEQISTCLTFDQAI
jgi:hypothetical protein